MLDPEVGRAPSKSSPVSPIRALLRDAEGRAVAFVFAAAALLFANWAARIPAVQEALALSPSALGVALTGAPLGGLVAMLAIGPLTSRLGAGRMTYVAGLALCAAAVLPALAPSFAGLLLALACIGVASGLLNVAMNAVATSVEARLGRPVLAACHGFYSLGGGLGAAIGAVAAGMGVPLPFHLVVVGGLIGLALQGLRKALCAAAPPEATAAHEGPVFALPTGPLFGVAVVGFLMLIGEGAMADWSAVYLRVGLGTSAGVAALGYAAFSLTMAAGRFAGDRAVERLGSTGVVRGGALLAAAGLGGAVLLGHPVAALVGFACAGLGYAGVAPVLYRAGAQAPGSSAGTGIAAVASASTAGFLAGPPLIGFVAEGIGLAGALGLIAALAALAAVLAKWALAKTRG